jgi:pyruvate/2-oxoglutarate dehydrogenase complex dihydrolipoamide dehydrogenase (E3) component
MFSSKKQFPDAKECDLLVIGLGPAGMACSIMGSAMGLNVVGIEKEKIGGECQNVGCIPSKALLRMAQHHHVAKTYLNKKELPVPEDIFERIQKSLDYIGEKKTKSMFDKVDLKQGEATFVGEKTVEVNGETITGKNVRTSYYTTYYISRYLYVLVLTLPYLLYQVSRSWIRHV